MFIFDLKKNNSRIQGKCVIVKNQRGILLKSKIGFKLFWNFYEFSKLVFEGSKWWKKLSTKRILEILINKEEEN